MAGIPRQRVPSVKLEDLLLRHGSITQEQLEKAQQEKKKWGGEIGRTLVDLGFISEELLMKALAHQLGTRMCNPAEDTLSEEIVKALGVQLCERHGIIAVGGDLAKKTLQVATSDPANQSELRTISQISGFRIEPLSATTDSIQRAIRRYYYGDQGAAAAPRESRSSGMADVLTARGADGEEAKGVAHDSAQLAAVWARLAQLEAATKPQKEQMAQLMSSNPQVAAITARLEKLEQLTASQLNILRITGEILIEKGIVTKEEYFARIRRR